MKQICILVIIVLTSFSSFAFKAITSTISGTVHDEKDLPLVHSTVLLLNSKDSGLVKGDITNEKGVYQFEQIENGSYIICSSNIGFKKYYSSVVVIDEGNKTAKKDIKLELSDKLVKEVKVMGKKPMIEVKADKTVFNVEESINATGSNALDLLRKSPGVHVDKDERIEMRGKNNVLVYLDGKPTYLSSSDLAAMLKNMQSTDVESIELITNPSAKYDAEGNAGIINIKLKKNKKFGTNGSLNLGVGYGKYLKQNEGINLNYRNKKVNVFGGYSFNSGKRFEFQHLDRIQNGVRYNLASENNHTDETHGLRVGADYYVNAKSVLGVMAHLMNTQSNFSSTSKTYIGQQNSPYEKVLVATNSIPGSRKNASYNINYKYEDTFGRSFTLDLDYGNFISKGKSYQPNTYWNTEESTMLSQSIFRNNTPTKIDIFSVKSDYEQNFLKGKLGLGIKVAYVKTDNDFKFYDVVSNIDTLNLNRTNHFLYTENVNAAYVNYSRQINAKFSTQVGLRGEQTNSSGMLSSAHTQQDDTVKRNYINLFPSAGFSYTINEKNALSLTYSRRIDRPDYQDLNPFENKLDELTYQKGNAFLRPQYTNSIDLTHTFMQFLTTSLNYSHTKDIYMQTTDTTEGSRTYVTQKNFASQDQVGVNMSFPLPVRKWWMIYANLNANYTVLKADFEGRKLENKYVGYTFFADNTITLPKDFALNITAWYTGPSYWGGTFKMRPMGTLDLGVKKTFMQKKLTAKVSLSDIFRTQQWHALSNFGGLYMNATGYNESRQLRINLSYRFGSNQIAKQREHTSGASSESDRIK